MLARWFDRSGIGQVLAPDEKVAKEPVPDEAKSTFWQIVAPDPNFTPPAVVPPRDSFMNMPTSEGQVLCEHCNKWTNTSTPRKDNGHATPQRSGNLSEGHRLFTPSPSVRRAEAAELEAMVLCAARGTSASILSPPDMKDARAKVFRICGNKNPPNEKLQKRLRTLFKKNPDLLHARAANLGETAPDGFTPLLAAAYANNSICVKLILDLSPMAYKDVGLQGQSALHIASEAGNIELVNLLHPIFQPDGPASPPPVDLAGRTPLGRALCSPNPSARKKQKELESVLFSPGDLSIFGEPKVGEELYGQDNGLQIAYGTAEMPGMRVDMEDSKCTCLFQKDGKSYFLAGVFDGHGDSGRVSKFVSEHIPSVLQNNMEGADLDWESVWLKTCQQVDAKLKEASIPGGSTAVMALITDQVIVVANVGDSRAILIQSQNVGAETGLEDKMAALSVKPSDVTKEEPASPVQSRAEEVSASSSIQESSAAPDDSKPQHENGAGASRGPIPITLSEDHKPDLEEEKSRIEKAGLSVVPVTFMEGEKEVTIHKVSKGDSEQLAVSRAFGDFEYKLNSNLPPEEQAVAAVPEVRVHQRHHQLDRYLVLACDGVWDVMDNTQVMDFVVRQAEVRADMTETVLPEVGDALLLESLNRNSRDNMTTVIVALSNESEKISPVIKGKTLDFSD